jgi:DNA repair protein RecO (recombination protein O)
VETTDAVVVRATAVGESDLVLGLYTRALGRVSAIARGARSSRRRFAGALGTMVVSDVALSRRTRGGELWNLDAATPREDCSAIAADPIGLGHASYGIELVRELTPAEVPEPAILDLLVELWRQLAAGPSPSLLRGFELRLCALLGSDISLDQCAACHDADRLDDGAVFDPTRGGVLCRVCAVASRGPGVRPLPGAARHYLQTIARVPLGGARELDQHDDDRIAARDAVLAFVGHLVGRPLRTIAYVAQVHAALRRPV